MKTIRAIIITVLLMFALQCAVSAQEVVVKIKPSTAEYFLEADDERFLLRDKVIELENNTADLKTKISNLQAINQTHVIEAVLMTDEFNLVIDELNTCYADQDEAVVVVDKLQKQNKILKIAGVVLLVLALL